jgi:hypothetical protein
MQLAQKMKIGLDETRMLILGAQILLGFQFRSVFQDGYDALPPHASYANAASLLLMLSVTVLLIAPALYHRIIAVGEAAGRINRLTSKLAELALIPFALSLGLDLFIAIERIAGLAAGLLSGLGFAALALLAWHGIEWLRARHIGWKERAMAASQRDVVEKTSLHDKIDQMLTEARVILPGAQALLGFQLAIVVTKGFDALPVASKSVHAASLAAVAIAIILLMAPAAYHRIVYAGEDAPEFHRTGGVLVTLATLPLALGLSGDTYVVIAKIAQSAEAGIVTSALALLACLAMWHLYPALQRGRLRARRQLASAR